MKNFHLGILLSILFLCSCHKDPAIIEIRETELIGNWEAYEHTDLSTGQTIIEEPGNIFELIYSNAFELRDNNEYAKYYHQGGTYKPDKQRVTGIWRLVENKEQIFEHGAREVIVEIIALTEDQLIIEGLSFGNPFQYKLNKN